jgi:DNA-binding transcriptional ArsR family regulator
MRKLEKVFKALSDSTRIRLLKLLQGSGELCVCQITAALKMSQTRVSRNLGMLKDAGFVTDRRKGLWVFYSVNKEEINDYHKEINLLMAKWLNDEEVIKKDLLGVKKPLSDKIKKACGAC